MSKYTQHDRDQAILICETAARSGASEDTPTGLFASDLGLSGTMAEKLARSARVAAATDTDAFPPEFTSETDTKAAEMLRKGWEP